MKLRRITDLKELAKFTPKLLELYDTLDGRWEPDSTSHEFLGDLISHFGEDAYFLGDLDEKGEIVYFAVILRETDEKAFFWLFYMNKGYREVTKSILVLTKEFLRTEGFSVVYSQSTRTSSSYERWLEKFGAEKAAIVYKFKLN